MPADRPASRPSAGGPAARADRAGLRDGLVRARDLAAALPDLLVEARRVASTVAAGWHGRRRAGAGDGFWQFRPHVSGEPVGAIDWRRSARGDDPMVREREWEAAHTVWIALDRSASMDWRSDLATDTKSARAVVLALALADLLGRAGERVGVPALLPARSDRRSAERLAAAFARLERPEAWPPALPLVSPCDGVVIGDFLARPSEVEARLAPLAGDGARLHLLRLVDPAEASLPWTGRVAFRDPETGAIFDGRRAETLVADWAARWAAHGEALAEIARRRSWTLLRHATDRPASEALLALHAALGGARGGSGR